MLEYFFTAIGLMAVCGVLYGSLKALRYDSFNKLLAYSSIGQVGYIALGFAVGNLYGLIGAVLHIISHAFMKTGLFYVSGALKYKYGITQVSSLGQIYKEMPVTAAALVIHALSMIGLPPLAGFFSKWYLGLGAVEEGNFLYLAALLFSSLLSALYFFRVLESLLMGEKKEKPLQREKKQGRRKGELPWQMILPIGMSAAAVIALGLGSSFLVEDILQGTLQEVFLR